MRTRLRAGVTWIGLGALAGCMATGSGEPRGVQTVDELDIRYLPAGPRFADVQDLSLTGEFLWVLDGAAPFLTRIPLASGRPLRLGGVGLGPTELLSPWAIQPAPDSIPGGVRVWDRGTNRVSTFDSAGALVESRRLSERGLIRARRDIRSVSYGDPFRVRSSGGHVFVGHYPRRIDRTADLREGLLRRVDARLEPGETVLRFSDLMTLESLSLEEWAAIPLWDACGETLAIWSPVGSEVVWVDLQGTPLHSEGVMVEPVPLTIEDVEAYLRWMARIELGPDFENAPIDFQAMAAANRDQFAEFRPRATDLRCEPGGAAWLRLFDTTWDPLGRGPTWLRVGRDGSRQRFKFPPEFTPTLFTLQGAYGVVEAPDGHHRLGSWRRGAHVEAHAPTPKD